MKYKLIALDLDGTLLNNEKIITPENQRALLEAQSAGVKVAIASGRMSFGVNKYAQQLEFEKYGGYSICFNGGLIIDAKGQVVFRKYIDKKYLKEICEIVADTDITVVVHKHDGLYGNNNRNPFTDVAPNTVKAPLTQVDDLYNYVNWDFHKILLVGELEKLKKLKNILTKKYSDNLEIYFSAPWFLEVMPKGTNKGTALKKLCEKVNIDINSTIACGDNFNDSAMLQVAGLSVVMANGEEKLKEKADYVTTQDCNNSGVAEVVNKFISDKI